MTQSGYVRRTDGTYLKKSLPPLELEYSKAELDTEVLSLDAMSLENLPAGFDGGSGITLSIWTAKGSPVFSPSRRRPGFTSAT